MSDELYAWQELGPDGRWGVIATVIPWAGIHGPLITRDQDMAEQHFAPIAALHAENYGSKVRLARFTLTAVEVTL